MSARAMMLPLAWLAAGCIQLSWNRESRHEPVRSADVAGLVAGESDLARCLGLFGAPLWVWERPESDGEGAVLAYGWFDEANFGLSFSIPVARGFSASFDYDQVDQRMQGLVLFFDADWRLRSWRTGLLRDLTREMRPVRPTPPPEDA